MLFFRVASGDFCLRVCLRLCSFFGWLVCWALLTHFVCFKLRKLASRGFIFGDFFIFVFFDFMGELCHCFFLTSWAVLFFGFVPRHGDLDG